MRIAIPTYGELVSPRFDCATTLVVVDRQADGPTTATEHDLATIAAASRPEFLAELGVAALLCGGIRRCDRFVLEGLGVEVIAGLMGRWRELPDAYLAGRLVPGWCGENGGRHGRGRGSGCRHGVGRGKQN